MSRVVLRLALGLAALAAAAAPASAQTGPHFYDVEAEVRVEGTVQSVRFESRYAGTAPFLILELQEKKTGRVLQVEVSPAWFFQRDLHQGEPIGIVGSLVSGTGRTALLIAREVTAGGETLTVRDRNGFPSWRGGARGASGRRGSGRD